MTQEAQAMATMIQRLREQVGDLFEHVAPEPYRNLLDARREYLRSEYEGDLESWMLTEWVVEAANAKFKASEDVDGIKSWEVTNSEECFARDGFETVLVRDGKRRFAIRIERLA